AGLQARASTTHTVTFSNPQGTDTTQTIADGERAKRPADPTRDGYLFDGWFIGSTPVAYDFNQPVTNDLKLTAHWTKADAWSMSPVQGPVAGGTKVTLTPPGPRGIRFSQVSAGRGHILAVASDGNLYAWGSNDHGQLGDGTTTERHEPVPVKKPQGVSQDFTWVQASAGYLFSVGLGSDGKLYSWGDNTYGQLGNNTTTAHYTPEPVNLPQNAPSGFTWKQEAVGSLHALGLGSDGNLYSWGDNDHNQLGDGTTTERHAPIQVKMPNGVPSGFTWKQMSG
ncbi:MAG: InlB B-repeat-containing protein, partial [Bifidobacterium sp.]|nr:InlB B-repeat-containing protein [Bifidobacterium sp.]